MNLDAKLAAIETLPRLGWVARPTPLTECTPLAEKLGLDSLLVKRDDLTTPLCGGSKARKLDYLLAHEPWASAERWAGVGALGSGQLVALVAAAKLLGREVDAYLFWQPPSQRVVESLAYVSSGPTRLRYSDSRVGLALSYPRALVGRKVRGAAVVPPGGTCPIGTLGTVRAGLELARQILSEDAAVPDRIYLPAGSGGTAVGIAIGVGLGGLRAEVHAVSVVEKVVIGPARLRRHRRKTMNLLERVGLRGDAAPIVLRNGFVGPGYGTASDDSARMSQLLRESGIPGDDVYTGKALACLAADAKEGATTTPVFWMTGRSDGLDAVERYSAETNEQLWLASLPPGLRVQLAFDGSLQRA